MRILRLVHVCLVDEWGERGWVRWRLDSLSSALPASDAPSSDGAAPEYGAVTPAVSEIMPSDRARKS